MKLLLPVDGSDFTKRMLAYIAAHDDLLGGTRHEYTALTVVPAIPSGASRYLERSTLDDYYREQAEGVLHSVAAFAKQQGWNMKTEYRVGHAPDVITAFIGEYKPDLVVMGSHGHSALGNVILGSVTNGVMSRTRTPMLLVR